MYYHAWLHSNVFSEGGGNSKKPSKVYWERTDEELIFPKNRGDDDQDDQTVNVTRNHLRSFSFFRLLTFDHKSAKTLQRRMQLSSKIQHNTNPYNTYGYDSSSKYYHYFASRAQIIAFSSAFSPYIFTAFLPRSATGIFKMSISNEEKFAFGIISASITSRFYIFFPFCQWFVLIVQLCPIMSLLLILSNFEFINLALINWIFQSCLS